MKDDRLIKKKLQISLRRLMRGESGSNTVAPYLGLPKINFLIKMQGLRQPDMNTDNFGVTWCVDHIVPLKLFNLNDPDDLALAWNHNNLLTMYCTHNFEKEHCLHISKELLSYLPDNEWTSKLKQKVNEHIIDFSIYSIVLLDDTNR